jgi:hypothetical protein
MNERGKLETIRRIEAWYRSRCDGDWEHEFGVKFDTLDNPGWSVTIDVVGTDLENSSFEFAEVDRPEDDNWVRCHINNQTFEGHGGPENLEEILQIFLNWACEGNDEWESSIGN